MRSEDFFAFLNERESIRLRKEAGEPFPWTDDEILRAYKFTNVRRFHDKTTTQLRENFYANNRDASKKEILMNCALARYFGTYEFMEAVGWRDVNSFGFEEIIEIAAQRLKDRERVFTGAYVITNQGIRAPKQEVVVNHFLKGLHGKLDFVLSTDSWQVMSELMSEIPGFGGTGFMAKEILLDTMMTDFWEKPYDFEGYRLTLPSDYDHWTPIGPGGLRGAARVLGDNNPAGSPVSQREALSVCLRLVEMQEEYWEGSFLFPTDIQFQLCEFDKYERVRLGQGRPRSRYHP